VDKLVILRRLNISYIKNYLYKLDDLNRLGNLSMFDKPDKSDVLYNLDYLKSLSILNRLEELYKFDTIDILNV